ncbi:dual specificity protein phosphatase 22 isoform X1 [Cricetulus griseus]|nr:dual specificity protein phosphatase 22 isoform X1 [Cricetulus griseus]
MTKIKPKKDLSLLMDFLLFLLLFLSVDSTHTLPFYLLKKRDGEKKGLKLPLHPSLRHHVLEKEKKWSVKDFTFQILPGLYIGNFKDARDAEQLSRNKVTHILSVHDSARPMMEGVKYLCIPAADSPSQNLTRHFKESIKFIHECRLQGEGCLVHCLAGVSRSVTLVIAYIMTVTDFGWEDALHTVRAGRSCANPNLGFQRQLQEFEKYEVHQYRQWLKEEYGENPLRDAEEAKSILAAPGILKYWAFLRRL